jgi:hypothetical protein
MWPFKKKSLPNLSLHIEIDRDGEKLIKCCVPKDYSPVIFANLLVQLFNKDPYLVEGILKSLVYWCEKDGNPDLSALILEIVGGMQNDINIRENPESYGLRSSIIKPSLVLTHHKSQLSSGKKNNDEQEED